MTATPTLSLPQRLRDLESRPTLNAALELFDDSEPVSASDMLGAWTGVGLQTGDALDGLLESFGWHGKRFDSLDDAHPLVFTDGQRRFSVNPALVPMRLSMRFNRLLRNRPMIRVTRRLVRALATTKPRARVRMMEYRGVVTATMSYDALPINDHFRRVDENTLIGLMDYRFSATPAAFVLRREAAGHHA